MRISAKPLLALRTWFIVAFVLAWNAGMLAGLALNDFRGGPTMIAPAMWVMVATLGCTSALALAIVAVPRLREALLEPVRRELYEPTPFLFIALVTATLVFVILVER